jgi:Zn-dependent peptidase ImmA (M78 family)/DNA-binding XRE family transcriptional regulator
MFNPNRLIIARKRRRLTQRELAVLVGINTVSMNKIERGLNNPTSETVDKIVKALEWPKDFFFGEDIDSPSQDAVSFRSLASMTAKERDAALSASSLAFLLSDWVTERFNLPGSDLISLNFEINPDKAALAMRQHWGLGEQPISNMVKLLESKGVRVFSLAENTKSVDAFSFWRDDTPYVFLNTFKSTEHSRFDAAHELGHLLLHKHGGPRQKDAEFEANTFASCFLMPEADIRSIVSYVTSINQLLKIKRRWGVSIAALIYRLHKIGILTDFRYRSLYIQISKMGYRTNEPNELPREESVIWKKVLMELWSDGITKNHIADDLHISPEEIENLVFMPNSFNAVKNKSKKQRNNLRIVS